MTPQKFLSKLQNRLARAQSLRCGRDGRLNGSLSVSHLPKIVLLFAVVIRCNAFSTARTGCNSETPRIVNVLNSSVLDVVVIGFWGDRVIVGLSVLAPRKGK